MGLHEKGHGEVAGDQDVLLRSVEKSRTLSHKVVHRSNMDHQPPGKSKVFFDKIVHRSNMKHQPPGKSKSFFDKIVHRSNMKHQPSGKSKVFFLIKLCTDQIWIINLSR